MVLCSWPVGLISQTAPAGDRYKGAAHDQSNDDKVPVEGPEKERTPESQPATPIDSTVTVHQKKEIPIIILPDA